MNCVDKDVDEEEEEEGVKDRCSLLITDGLKHARHWHSYGTGHFESLFIMPRAPFPLTTEL